LSLGFSARLITRIGAPLTLLPGLVLMAIGLVLFRGAPANANYWSDLLPVMVLLGVGAGLGFPSLMTLAMSAATPEDSGLASGLVNTTQQVGGALGLAVLATLSTTRSNSLQASGHSLTSSLISGYHLAFSIGAVLLIVAIGLTVALLTRKSPVAEAAEAEAVQFSETEVAYAEEAA
jgi:MFS family permease